MDLGVFYEVIVPLMLVEGTATICISTPLGQFNFYSELTEVRDDKGKRIFNVRHVRGKNRPSWQKDETQSRIQAIYGSRTTLYRREIMGEIADEGENMAFSEKKLKKLFDKPPMLPPYTITDQTIVVAIDPNGGASASDGPGSDTAIVSFVVSEGRVVIVGLESHPTKTPSQPRQILYEHLNALRRRFPSCRFLIIPEANLGDQAQLLAQMTLRRYRDVDVLCEFAHCYGVFTKPGDPEKYVARMRDKLAEDGIFFNNHIVSVNPYLPNLTNEQRADTVLKEFKRQLVSFRAIHIVPTSLASRVRVMYSGKADKDNKRSKSAKDDMVLAFLFGLYYYGQYMSPHNLVNTRDSHNMLKFDAYGGTTVETGRQSALPHVPYANNLGRTRMRDDEHAFDDGGGDVRRNKRART